MPESRSCFGERLGLLFRLICQLAMLYSLECARDTDAPCFPTILTLDSIDH